MLLARRSWRSQNRPMSNTLFPDATALERSRALGLERGQAHAGGAAPRTEGDLAFPDAEAKAALEEWSGHNPAAFGMLLEAAMDGYRDGLGGASPG